jgi:N-acetylglucosaminyldiphosphoundecaprenol N-acetyl-beta-D-mannosaminyltransferase
MATMFKLSPRTRPVLRLPRFVEGLRRAQEPDQLEPLTVMGLRVDRLDGRQVVRHIMGELDRGSGGWVATPNLEILRMATSDQAVHRLLGSATLLLNDGAPLEWAGKLSGQGESPRATGASVFWLLVAEAARRDRRVLLLGGRDGAGELAAQRLRELHPELSVATLCPPLGFEHDAAEMAKIRRTIVENESDIVFCGFGCPKQERLMAQLHPEFPRAWFLGVGGSIDFAAGLVPRAPEWVQRLGHEWVFRLAVEPRRLAGRYLVHDVPFAFVLFAWALQERMAMMSTTRPHGRAIGSISPPVSSERTMNELC